MWVKVFVLLFTVSMIFCTERKITSVLNPSCVDCNASNITLLYVRAEGVQNVVHQIWDFTRGKPTIIFAITDHNTTLGIEWEQKLPKSFILSKDPTYSFGIILNKLFEYNDLEDIGEFDPKSEVRILDTRHFRWNRTELVLQQNEAMLHVSADGYHSHHVQRNGIFAIKLDLLPFIDYATDLPHLIHSSNSTLVDLSLVNFTTTESFNSSRYAVELLFVSTDGKNDTMKMRMRKSLDDEHTPGIFEIVEITTPESYKHDDGGFVQFRPAAYVEPQREVTSSTNVYAGAFNRSSLDLGSTAHLFYADSDPAHLLVQRALISLGGSGDGFYNKTNYVAWSFTVGYGLPPVEGFSMFVILVISIGLGIPVCLLLTGAAYVVTRRRQQRNAPERLQDGEFD